MCGKTLAVLIIGIIIGIFLPDVYSYTTNAFAEPITPPEILVPTTNNTNITCVPLDTGTNMYKITVSSAAQLEEPPYTWFFVRWGPGDLYACHDADHALCIGGSSNVFDIEANFTGLKGEIPIIFSQVPYTDTEEKYTVELGNETVIKEIRYRIPSQP